MRTMTRYGAITLMGALLASCAPQIEDLPEDPGIDDQIHEAVATSAKANKAIAEVEVATAAPVRPGPAASVPAGVVLPADAVQPVTIDWQGAIEPFLAEMARRAGYSYRTTGKAPANPVMITITANEEPLFGVVRRAGNMAHGYADIAFNPTARLIEIRYGR